MVAGRASSGRAARSDHEPGDALRLPRHLRRLPLPRPERLPAGRCQAVLRAAQGDAGSARLPGRPAADQPRAAARQRRHGLPPLAADRRQQRRRQVLAGQRRHAAHDRARCAVGAHRLRALAHPRPDDAGQGSAGEPRGGARAGADRRTGATRFPGTARSASSRTSVRSPSRCEDFKQDRDRVPAHRRPVRGAVHLRRRRAAQAVRRAAGACPAGPGVSAVRDQHRPGGLPRPLRAAAAPAGHLQQPLQALLPADHLRARPARSHRAARAPRRAGRERGHRGDPRRRARRDRRLAAGGKRALHALAAARRQPAERGAATGGRTASPAC